MNKNREGVLIYTYSPEFHNELLVLIGQAHQLATAVNRYLKIPLHYRGNGTDLEGLVRSFAVLEDRLRKAMAEMEEPPK